VFIRRLLFLVCLCALPACGSSVLGSPTTTTTSTATYTQIDLVVGTGATATTGRTVTVNYGLWLYDSTQPDGKGTNIPQSPPTISFVLGAGQVIAGWDQGVPGMKVGGQRRLIIPPNLAYGSTSPSPSIPANASLVFDIALTNVQ
jgi:FKBP-type peptidyl-prolyl cis-trans isomerase FkpA